MYNIEKIWSQRNDTDVAEGGVAYLRYNTVMGWFADFYNIPLGRVVSAFVALSPNNDYHSNLRSLASVLHGFNTGTPDEAITVTTYNACRDRALSYLRGVNFMDTVKGPKIRAFRDNILNPTSSQEITIDGHMICIWHGIDMTMKEAARLLKSNAQYHIIAADFISYARQLNIAPCNFQAILWFTRKRLRNIKYNAQLDLFGDINNSTKTLCRPEDYPPYNTKQEIKI